jgi:Fe-S cluster assembly protein SufD
MQNQIFEEFIKQGIPNRKTERWQFTPIAKFIDSTTNRSSDISLAKIISELKEKRLWEEDDSLFKLHLSKIKSINSKKIETYLKSDTEDQDTFNKIELISNEGAYFEYISCKENQYIGTSNLIEVKENQTLTHIQFIDGDPLEVTNGRVRQNWNKVAITGKNANYHFFQIYLGGCLFRSNPMITIDAERSHAELLSFYLGLDFNHFDIFSKINHLKSFTTSNQEAKGLLAQNSKSVFTGNIFIDKGIEAIQANQFNKNLILADSANAISRPQLEIFSDDVKCSHGSTTGHLDPEQIFYLSTRGISKNKAQMMMAASYANVILNKITSVEIKKMIEKSLNQKLGKLNG